ncbi:MAG: non-heme iron oxygenase ferredoxin subunit [Myxococcota bacterium]
MTWLEAEGADALAEGEKASFHCHGVDVLICRVEGQLYAVEDLCSHAQSTLSDGTLEGYAIRCPLHGASFDVRDGSHLTPPAFQAITGFEIEEEGGRVRIRLPEGASRPARPFARPTTR